nr:MAG TPA: hypothetical protein [Caudoviricetes sp.]
MFSLPSVYHLSLTFYNNYTTSCRRNLLYFLKVFLTIC